jgi:hypothetical protein
MQQIDQIVEMYLNMDTNYALMITGAWGTGKTFYYKNYLKPKIEKTVVRTKPNYFYKSVHISLFGMKSIDEIQTEIFLDRVPLLKNKFVKLGTEIGKALLKSKVTSGDFSKDDWIDFEELVICFDDLERISKNLNIEEVIGYINSLVENQNVKVLIIANEGKISGDDYFSLKEKTVGNSIEFIPDFDTAYDSLTTSKFLIDSEYFNYLQKQKQFILSIFKTKSTNLRILGFALNYFQIIFKNVNDEIKDEKILKQNLNQILIGILKFTLCISIEYKNGVISFADKKELDRPLKLTLTQIINPENGSNDTEYLKFFAKTYYDNERFTFYETVYNFITGGEVLDTKKLIAYLRELYHIVGDVIPLHYQVLNKCDIREAIKQSDDEYLNNIKDLLKYTDLGLYDINHYPSIFMYVTRFHNPLNLNLDRLVSRIIKGLKRGKSQYKYIASLDMHFELSSGIDHREHLQLIIDACFKINKKLKDEEDNLKLRVLEKLFYSDINKFSNSILDNSEGFEYIPVFQIFKARDFYSHILRGSNQAIRELSNIFHARTSSSAVEFKRENEFLDKVQKLLDKKTAKLNGKGLKGYLLDDLNFKLKKYRQYIGK